MPGGTGSSTSVASGRTYSRLICTGLPLDDEGSVRSRGCHSRHIGPPPNCCLRPLAETQLGALQREQVCLDHDPGQLGGVNLGHPAQLLLGLRGCLLYTSRCV